MSDRPVRRSASTDVGWSPDAITFAIGSPPHPLLEPNRWRRLRWALALAVLAAVAVVLIGEQFGLWLPFPLVGAVFVGVVLIGQGVSLVSEPEWLRAADLVRPVRVHRRLQPGGWYEGGDGLVAAVRRWDRQIEWGSTGPARFANTVGTHIGEVVDERLRQRYGITRASDPQRARELAGETLWALMGPLTRVPTHRQMLAALDDLERI
ncbi:MAG TPA: hypothetical protein VH561_13150 [Micromonosporaceae bacterium]|jgi:hypothetical protein